jgi:hypothetical protein
MRQRRLPPPERDPSELLARFFRSRAGTLTSGVVMRRTVLSFALPVLLVNALPAIAQNSPSNSAPRAPVVVTDSTVPLTEARVDSSTVGPSRDGLRAGVHLATTARPNQPLMAPNQAGLGEARAMMIVGGAALIVGAVIGDTPGTVIMVGGAVIGLVGLYKYLQ